MKSKIIVHNESNISDTQALDYVINCYDKMDQFSYCEFTSGIRVQLYHMKTCKTFYVYGEENNAE